MNGGPYGIFAVLLAAGTGSRFGGDKLLAPFGEKTLVGTTLSNLSGAPVDEVVAVIGPGDGRLRGICASYGARVVENPDRDGGQSTSVLTGLRAARPAALAAVVLLADQPFVGAGAVRRLAGAFENGAGIAVATYGGKRRNPVLFAREVWPLLGAELSGDEGARGVLRRHPELTVEVACDGVGDPADVDTRRDLARLDGMRGAEGGLKMERR